MKFEVKNGSFAYSKEEPVLKNVNFCMDKPEIMTILGANGAGKTTLLKCMLGLLHWTGGASYLDETELTKIKNRDLWKKIGYVPQAKGSSAAYTVEDMIVLGRNAYLGTFGLPGKEDYRIADECMEEIGITWLKGKLCNQISGGELQMVLIARALAAKPSLLIMDEPESNLDFRNQMIVLETIKRLCRERNISAIVNTHYPEHALSIADKAFLLYPDGENLFGEAEKVITEENLSRAFEIGVCMRKIDTGEGEYTSIIPLAVEIGKKGQNGYAGTYRQAESRTKAAERGLYSSSDRENAGNCGISL